MHKLHQRRAFYFVFLIFGFSIRLLAAPHPGNEWMVLLTEAPVVERFPGRIERTEAASEPYRQHLREVQQAIRGQIEALQIPVTGAVQHLLNGVFVRATPAQAAMLRGLSGVAAVIPLRRYHLDDQLSLSDVQQAWNSSGIGGRGNAGLGLKIAIIDTGIDQTHSSFQDSTLSPPSGFPKCGVPSDCTLFTNNKVIVARSYVSTLTAGSNPGNPAADSRPDDLSARDYIGHGTAVASVAAGAASSYNGTAISGVAPKAFLGNYKVFGSPEVDEGASDTGIIEALDDAVTDGMDVVNLSSGSPAYESPLDTGATCDQPTGTPCDPAAAAVENAMQSAEVIVVVAAGNAGASGYQAVNNGLATYSTVESPAYTPSAIAAGGIQNDVTYVNTIDVSGAGVPPNLATLDATPSGDGPLPSAPLTAPLLDVTQLDASDLFCTVTPPTGSLSGDIALILRGTCDFSVKVENAEAGGAVGVIFINNSSTPAIPGGLEGTTIPAYLISQSDGENLRSFVDENPGTNVTLNPAATQVPATSLGLIPDSTAYFASRGPAIGTYGVKPDVSAVATDFLLAAEDVDPFGELFSPTRYTVAAGTSFATPMLAGTAALVKQVQPNLTPLEVKSVLVNSGTLSGILNQAGTAPAAIADVGSGLLQAQSAVLPQVVFVPSTVSFGLLNTALPAAQTIAVTNVSGSALTLGFSVSAITAAPAATVQVSSSSSATVTILAGQSTSITVRLSGSVPPAGRYEGVINVTGASVPLHIPYLFLVSSNTVYDVIPLFGGGFDGPIDQEIPADLGGGLLLRVIDRYGASVANAAVKWAAVEGGGQVLTSPEYTDATTDSDGVAYATVVLGPETGTQEFSATVAGLPIYFTGNARLTPAINPGGIIDGASFTAGRAVAPGSIISIFGANLADAPGSATQFPLPLGIIVPSLSGGTCAVAFSFDIPSAGISLPAHFHYVSPTQINLQVPWELANYPSATVKVIVNYTYSAEYTLLLANYAPGFFASGGVAAARDSASNAVTSSNPVARGTYVQLYMNGLGPVNNRPADGWPATDATSTTTAMPAISIGGQPAIVSFSGLAPGFADLYQVNAVVPSGIGTGSQPVTCSIGGVSCQTVTLYVR
jgi:minor extracellular serine protease Vpr